MTFFIIIVASCGVVLKKAKGDAIKFEIESVIIECNMLARLYYSSYNTYNIESIAN